MEDGDIGAAKVQAPLNDAAGVAAGECDDIVAQSPSGNMANYPDVEVTVINKSSKTNSTGGDSGDSVACRALNAKTAAVSGDGENSESSVKVNGDSDRVVNSDEHDEDDTSDEDALVIDEGCKKDDDTKAITTTTSTILPVAATAPATSGNGGGTANRKRVRSPSPRANFKGFKKRIIAKSVHVRKVVTDLKSASFYIDLGDGKQANTASLDLKICPSQTNSTSDNAPTPTAVKQNKLVNTASTVNSSSSSGGGSNKASAFSATSKPRTTTTTTTTTTPNRNNNTSSSSSGGGGANKRATNKKRPSQKLTEYAQYLGLQPAVKFKCVKCSESCFQSLGALNEHQRHCLSSAKTSAHAASVPAAASSPGARPTASNCVPSATGAAAGSNNTATAAATSTNFRVTRKVFLCSSCGTYYENCNLFLHMREVHRRYICLYCLGMFSLPEKLSHHLVTKHSCAPKHYASADDFLSSYTDSCFLVCCHCERVFSERDNFFEHVCVEKRTGGDRTCGSCGVRSTHNSSSGGSAHAATCTATLELLVAASATTTTTTATTTTTSSSSSSPVNKPLAPGHQQPQQQSTGKGAGKHSKVSKSGRTSGTALTPVEHVTADSPSAAASPGPSTVVEAPEHPADMNTGKECTAAVAAASPVSQGDGHEDSMDAPSPQSSTINPVPSNGNDDDPHHDGDAADGSGEAAETHGAMSDEVAGVDPQQPQQLPADGEMPIEVEKATENHTEKGATADTAEENRKADTQEESSVEPENPSAPAAATTTTPHRDVADSEDETKSQTDGQVEGKSASDHKDEEERTVSASSDESVLSERNNSEAEEEEQGKVAGTPPTQDTTAAAADGGETNEPADNGRVSRMSMDLNQQQSDEPEHKSDSGTNDDDDDDDHNKNGGGEDDNDEAEEEEEEESVREPVQETRKVPKVTLRLPPQAMVYSDNDSDDSEKLTMEVEEGAQCDSDEESQDKPVNGFEDSEHQSDEEYVPVAGEDVPIVELELEQPLDKFSVEGLLRRCLGATVPTCVYCNHARKIAVNGKQLGLHAIAEHRFAATVNSITAEELIPASFVTRIKECLAAVESVYFSLDMREQAAAGKEGEAAGGHEEDGEGHAQDTDTVATVATAATPAPPVPCFKRVYECFQCRYVTGVHKELYLHNRKMHAKTILLCIMCKSNFYSYSELICHLCPGNYVLHSETRFRCCMCSARDLPSAFRLMVHLRKRHHTCDVCLEGCHNQSKLSNHVWKHKLHHLCYRCGIAYRNKPDITKHLFWKHGTESVLCQRCLQKKWPHVYHFCIPPATFVCEECNLSFSRAVHLKVHKRLHSNERPHACTEPHCPDTFISRKLRLKHEARHRDPVPLAEVAAAAAAAGAAGDAPLTDRDADNQLADATQAGGDPAATVPSEQPTDGDKVPDDKDEPKKSLIDVYDLPALNLSESDSDTSEDEKPVKQENDAAAAATAAAAEREAEEGARVKEEVTPKEEEEEERASTGPVPSGMDEDQKPVPILDGIWDNFKNYQATIEKRDGLSGAALLGQKEGDSAQCGAVKVEPMEEEDECPVPDLEVILADHDYCLPPETTNISIVESVPEAAGRSKVDADSGMDHDYCTVGKSADTSSSQAQQPPGAEGRVTDASGGGGGDKKKSKSTRKKSNRPHTGSSSSSDSSSDSDSSSCTCGSNCSCSSSSGSSSCSSSSSDSDSSSSEGKRRVQARRDRRKERAKRKKDSENALAATHTAAAAAAAATAAVAEEPPVLAPVPELPIEESDLDTEETETDEDFYDEHPQRLANKIMAEKRQQLALLAAVAPPINNGNVSLDYGPPTPPAPPTVPEEQLTTPPPAPSLPAVALKKKAKAKKRKKKSRSSTPKQDVPVHSVAEYPQLNHVHAMSPVPQLALQPPAPPLVPPVVVQLPPMRTALADATPKQQQQQQRRQQQQQQHRHHHRHNQGSGSETDSNVRSSKRRRVPNKFYGYSSDEDAHDKPAPGPTPKWRKSEISASVVTHHVTGSPQFVPPITIKNIPSPVPVIEPVRPPLIHHPAAAVESDSEEDEEEEEDDNEEQETTTAPAAMVAPSRKAATSDSSDSNRADEDDEDSDSDAGQLHISQPPAVQLVPQPPPPPSGYSAAAIAHHQAAAAAGERHNENLYCYCQCPYDEVSEMIACDGRDCAIEWFHFECVGIMVPPKGKWFCPDCRRKSGGTGAGIGRSDFIQT